MPTYRIKNKQNFPALIGRNYLYFLKTPMACSETLTFPPHDSIMHLCRPAPRGPVQPCVSPPGLAVISNVQYVSPRPLPVGVGLPPEARLTRPAVSAACQTGGSAGVISGRWVTCGECFTATCCLYRPEIATCLTVRNSQVSLQGPYENWTGPRRFEQVQALLHFLL